MSLFPAALRRALLRSCLVLAALAYGRLLVWDPSNHLLPGGQGWFFVPFDTSPQVVFTIAAGLLYVRRRRLVEVRDGRPTPLLAWASLIPASLLYLWGHFTDASDLVLLSLIPMAAGIALLTQGARFARRLLPPLLFLLFAIPLPGVLSNQLVFPLQLSTAAHTEWLLNTVGVSAFQEGDVIYLAERSFEVIETCSGIRSMEVLTMLAVAWVIWFPVSALHAVALVAGAPVIAYLVNMVRVMSLILNPESNVSAMHTLQGVMLFLCGTVLLYALDALLYRIAARWPRSETHAYGEADDRRDAQDSPGEAGHPALQSALLAGLLGALLLTSLLGQPWPQTEAACASSKRLPQYLGDWTRTTRLRNDRPYLWTVRFAAHDFWRYTRGHEAVDVLIACDDRELRRQSSWSPKNVYPSRGWRTEEAGPLESWAGVLDLSWVVARSKGKRILSHYGYSGFEPFGRELFWALTSRDRSPFRRIEPTRFLRLSTPVKPTPRGRNEAEDLLDDLLELLQPQLAGSSAQNPPWGPGDQGSD